MDIVTILIRIWKVALLHKVSRADSVIFALVLFDLFLFSLPSHCPKTAE